jgi:hypothetical protein
MIMKIKFTLAASAIALALGSPVAQAFTSGSTGSDGAFSPTVNTQLTLPASGVFNFTSVNIPTGVTVTFKKNALNTPVVLLASGNVTIAGTVNANGTNGTATGASGDGNLGDDGLPGEGGAGGFNGGRGGAAGITDNTNTQGSGGAGLGPGAGAGAPGCYYLPGNTSYPVSGASGSFGAAGSAGTGAQSYPCSTSQGNYVNAAVLAGSTYGSSSLVPMIGGSGGGGGSGGSIFGGAGGGGGGGAVLIAASGTVTVSGQIYAAGGAAGILSGTGVGGNGGVGSGGAIKIVATTIAGNGSITALSGDGYSTTGRIRLESEAITRTAGTNPAYSFAAPGPLFVAGLPTLMITSVAGVAAPAIPTGNADIILPSTTPNPVSVVFQTTGVPVGNTVKLTIIPTNGLKVVAISPALTGSTDNASATVSVSLPSGPSTLSASTAYTIVASLGDAMSNFAMGERVEKVVLTATPGQPQQVTLVTTTGKEYAAPPAALAMLAMK